MAEPTVKRGTGWIVFAGVLMVLAGGNMFINGLWALHTNTQVANSFKGQLLFSDNNLDTWGWIYVIVGLVVLLAGLCVFARQHWAVNVGVVVALIQAIFAFFWIFTGNWPAAVVVIAIDLLIIYGLTTYGER
ncbi:MAG: hypothetical protein U0W40_11785 [Acidimicrobiia bacterium]